MNFNLKGYLESNFSEVKVESPLFYNAPIGIRFELGVPYRGIEDPNYFLTVHLRAKTIFESLFSEQDDIVLLVKSFEYVESFMSFFEEQPIFSGMYIRKERLKEVKLYERFPDVDEDSQELIGYTISQMLRCHRSDLKYTKIFQAIGNQDFRKIPYITDGIFIINLSRNIIFYMYDDRGLDVIASDKNSLKTIYKLFNNWILDYDRERIDKIFVE